ncbi:MAG: DNA-3-methyladenine glycosylase [Mucispirillum sp.]|nr:DNA-3-methyladenine glycosylase [Mucispirillum sp.]
MLDKSFFDKDVCLLGKELLGKVICRRISGVLCKARIIETESYSVKEKASHSSLGYTEKRKAMFMDAGTIYMYHSRAGASFNISAKGWGDAVLIKSAVAFEDNCRDALELMAENRASLGNRGAVDIKYLCSGQTLLCKSLLLKVADWNAACFNEYFYIDDIGYVPEDIIVTSRLGIPKGRDEDKLPYRFVDKKYIKYATKGSNIKYY